MKESDIPLGVPNDFVSASHEEIANVENWANDAFELTENGPGNVKVDLKRQDYDRLGYGVSCVGGPLQIGEKVYQHGLGTHANSEILVTLPKGAKRFEATVGVNKDDATDVGTPTVQFIVEVHGKELLRTPTLTGKTAPVPVKIDLDDSMKEITLKVDCTPDGPSFDHANWADARILMNDGSVQWLDSVKSDLMSRGELPFSFAYGGVSSNELLSTWQKSSSTRRTEDAVERTVEWTDPKTGLRVTAVVKTFKAYSAVEWVLYFENTGKSDTPILEAVRALDLSLNTPQSRPATLHRIMGDGCDRDCFAPYDTAVGEGQKIEMAPVTGRSSSVAFPFFNFQSGNNGLIAAVGWTGQWSASLDRSVSGITSLKAGMELTHTILYPGEKIRTPRILLMPWKDDIMRAHNQLRRMMLFHYMPKENGRPARLPISLQCWDRYWGRPGMASETRQISEAKFAHEIGCDTLWVDAAWFPPDFGSGAGNWFPKPTDFPRGLKPVSDVCHGLGMKFLVWFEPERVAKGTQIANEHPEFVFGGKEGGLFKMNDPTARQWMTDLLVDRLKSYGIDVYREDANIDMLPFWRQNDAPDRQGITEIRYIEGLYQMWDDIRSRCPGILIDNCSSGGRRIDLESCMRTIPMWRSDTGCGAGRADWNQSQTYGLSQYIPLHEVASWTSETYENRSSATAGALCEWGFLEPGFSKKDAQKALAEVQENQKYWYGDFYPITGYSIAPDRFMAYQFHRSDLDEGLVLAFRRKECRTVGMIVSLNALNPSSTYSLEFVDDSYKVRTRRVLGKDLISKGVELRIPKESGSVILRYKAISDEETK
jgi:alpha-galactosidase